MKRENQYVLNFVYLCIILILLVKVVDMKDINNKLRNSIKQEETNHSETLDKHFDLEVKYGTVFDECIRLENEIQILSSYLANDEYEKYNKKN